MRTLLFRSTYILAVGLLSCVIAAEKPYVIDRQGNKHTGQKIRAEEDGEVILTLGKGAEQVFSKKRYHYAYIPKPRNVGRLEKAFENEQYEIVREKAPGIFENYKFLGWAATVGRLHGRALIQDEQYEKALKVFTEALNYPIRNEDREKLRLGQAECHLELGRKKEARNLLDLLKKSESNRIAAFSFMANGRLLAEEGKKRAAVLELMKTVLLFSPEDAGKYRGQARETAIKLLKEMGDSRYKYIQENT